MDNLPNVNKLGGIGEGEHAGIPKVHRLTAAIVASWFRSMLATPSDVTRKHGNLNDYKIVSHGLYFSLIYIKLNPI